VVNEYFLKAKRKLVFLIVCAIYKGNAGAGMNCGRTAKEKWRCESSNLVVFNKSKMLCFEN